MLRELYKKSEHSFPEILRVVEIFISSGLGHMVVDDLGRLETYYRDLGLAVSQEDDPLFSLVVEDHHASLGKIWIKTGELDKALEVNGLMNSPHTSYFRLPFLQDLAVALADSGRFEDSCRIINPLRTDPVPYAEPWFAERHDHDGKEGALVRMISNYSYRLALAGDEEPSGRGFSIAYADAVHMPASTKKSWALATLGSYLYRAATP